MLNFYTKATILVVTFALALIALLVIFVYGDAFLGSSRLSLFFNLYVVMAIPLCVFILIWRRLAEGFIFRPYLARLVDIEKAKAIHKLTTRLAHDITPLFESLKRVAESKTLEDKDRLRLNVVARHLEAIERDLKSTYKKTNPASGLPSFCFPYESIKNVADQLQNLAKAQGVEIKLAISKSTHLFGVAVSATEIERIFSNLLRNAIYASPQKSKITIRGTKKGTYLQYQIEDNGQGMNREMLAAVKCEGASNKKEGAGLGLKIVREAISEAQGYFDIRSKRALGTTATITLPITPTPHWLTFEIKIPKDKKIVVIEESELTRELWRARLKKHPFEFLQDADLLEAGELKDTSFFIFGHNKFGASPTIFDVIRENKIESSSLITTTDFNDPSVQQQAMDLKLKILPQYLISQAEIEVGP